jgi:hypothetical protein
VDFVAPGGSRSADSDDVARQSPLEDESGRTGLHWMIFQRRANGEWRVIDPDPPRRGTLRLDARELAYYQGVTYLEVAARLPWWASLVRTRARRTELRAVDSSKTASRRER